jgi:hypothetical protein
MIERDSELQALPFEMERHQRFEWIKRLVLLCPHGRPLLIELVGQRPRPTLTGRRSLLRMSLRGPKPLALRCVTQYGAVIRRGKSLVTGKPRRACPIPDVDVARERDAVGQIGRIVPVAQPPSRSEGSGEIEE